MQDDGGRNGKGEMEGRGKLINLDESTIHNRFVSSRGVGIQDFKLEKPWRPPSLVLEVDPPEHTKNRRFLTRALSPNKISQLKDFFKDCADKLIRELLEKKKIDGISDLAEIFPTREFP